MDIQIGDIVHYVLKDGINRGCCRPAMVVDIQDGENGILKVQVFMTLEDGARYGGGLGVVSVTEGRDQHDPGRWHRKHQ